MCFSASASLAAGAVTSGVGVFSLKSVRRKREIPLALIPLLFGIQQFIEGGIWLSFGHPLLNQVLTYIYIFYANIWWPAFVPIAIFLVEENKLAKKILFILMPIGFGIGIYLTVVKLLGPVSSSVVNNCIVYAAGNNQTSDVLFGFYMLATCISCFISSHIFIRIFGIGTIIAAYISFLFYSYAFTSVWCFFAAILSFIILFHFHFRKKLPAQRRV
jgi:hypothetical protein